MVEMDTGEQLQIGGFNVQKASEKRDGANLNELFDKMQIAVVGRENQEEDSGISDDEDESSDEVGDMDEELKYQQDDPNFLSQRH